jgi:hypothetical protein
MNGIRWGSLIADANGEIEQAKLKSLAAIGLASGGGLVTIAVMTGLLNPPTDLVMIGVASLVLPLTGGKIGDAVALLAARRQPVPPEPPSPQ